MDIWVNMTIKLFQIIYVVTRIYLTVCSGFTRLYGVATASETYEGENTVLWLQVAR